MKIAAISDMHGILDFNVEKSDILFICGDIVPLKIQGYSKESKRWFKNTFIPWCKNQPVNDIYLVGGNHDWWIYRHPEQVKECCKELPNLHYLLDEEAVYMDEDGTAYKIYGTPWCHQFGDWAFMGYSDNALAQKFMNMGDDIDFLITHDAPYGVSDICDSFWNRGEHIGSHGLAYAIAQRQPKYNFHGHLHSSNHGCEMLENTQVYNVSMIDEQYKLRYYPLYLEL